MRGLVIRGRRIPVADAVLTGSGVAMLIDSLLPWYGYDASGWHPTYDGFQSGFLVFLALVIVALIAGTAATRAWTGTKLGRVGGTAVTWDGLFLAGDALALVLVVLFWATLPSLLGASTGTKIGMFIGLILILVQAAGVLMALVEAGLQLPVRPRRTATG